MTDSKHSSALLKVRNLSVTVAQNQGSKPLVNDLSFDIPAGKTVALVGESGRGKSLTALSILRLLPDAVPVAAGGVWLHGRPLFCCHEQQMRQVRGKEIGMIIREPQQRLDQVLPI